MVEFIQTNAKVEGHSKTNKAAYGTVIGINSLNHKLGPVYAERMTQTVTILKHMGDSISIEKVNELTATLGLALENEQVEAAVLKYYNGKLPEDVVLKLIKDVTEKLGAAKITADFSAQQRNLFVDYQREVLNLGKIVADQFN